MAEEHPREQPPRKKPYVTPELTVYGGLSQITRAVQPNGNLDGATTGQMNSA